jgi:hypothetical protein
VVIAQRLEAIAGSCSVHDRRQAGQRHRCLCTTNRVARPKHGRSTNTTLNRPGSDGGSGYWFPTPIGVGCWAA